MDWSGKRGGRAGSLNSSVADIESGGLGAASHSLEQSNEQALGLLEERARLIKELTRDIHGEVKEQNKFLDGMGLEMESARLLLAGTVDKFTKVFSSKGNRNFAVIVVSCVVLVVVLYFFVRR